ncbi:hypothetical protein Tco_1525413 [Tanacetum coccineum]
MIMELDKPRIKRSNPLQEFNEKSRQSLESEELSDESLQQKEVGGYSSDGSSRSRSRVRASRTKSSSDSGYDIVLDSGSKDLRMPYRRPKPIPFTSRITCFRYHQRAKLQPNVRVYEGNKDLEDHLSVFYAAT